MFRHLHPFFPMVFLSLTAVYCQMGDMDTSGRHGMTAKAPQVAPSPATAMDDLMHSADDAMMAIPACGSVDVYFAQTMIAHHQGAIRMAQWYLQHGSTSELRNISDSIVISQTQEIAQFRSILATLSAPAGCISSPAPSMAINGVHGPSLIPAAAQSPAFKALAESMSGMMAPSPDMPMDSADAAYAENMRMHHMAAVDMARVQVQYGSNSELIELAKIIVAEQTVEIGEFNSILAEMSAAS